MERKKKKKLWDDPQFMEFGNTIKKHLTKNPFFKTFDNVHQLNSLFNENFNFLSEVPFLIMPLNYIFL